MRNSKEIFSATGLKPVSPRRARKADLTDVLRLLQSMPRGSAHSPKKDSTKAQFHAVYVSVVPRCAGFWPGLHRAAAESRLACKITRICLAPFICRTCVSRFLMQRTVCIKGTLWGMKASIFQGDSDEGAKLLQHCHICLSETVLAAESDRLDHAEPPLAHK